MSLRRAGFLIAGLSLALCGCQSQNSEVRAQAEKRWSEARADVKAQLAEDRFHNASLDEAAAAAHEALKLAPERSELAVLTARIELSRGDDVAAERLLQSLGDAGAERSDAQYLFGVIWQQRQRWEQALAHFEAACALAPDEVANLVAVAQSLLQLGHAGEAMERLTAAENRFGWMPEYLTTLAECQEQAGEWSAAAANWARINAGADDCRNIERQASALLHAEQWADAADAYERALRCDKNADIAVRVALARCRFEAGQTEAARETLRNALELDHNNREALLLMSRLLTSEGRYRDALQVAEVLLRGAPREVAALELTASLAERCGRRKRAMTLAGQLLQIDPQNAVAQRILAARENNESGALSNAAPKNSQID